MNRLLPRLDSTNAQIALKTCLALILDLAVALQLDWKPSFGAILVVVLQAPAVGATYQKGLLYIAGTLSGALAGLLMVALFAHDRMVFIIAMALLIGFSVYRQQLSHYPYAWLVFIVTFVLVGFFSVQDPSNAFSIAVMRSSTICLAVIVVFLVHGMLWPIQAGKTFERQLRGFIDGCCGLLALMRRLLAGDVMEPDAIGKAVTAQLKALNALHSTLDTAVMDTERFRRFHTGYERLLEQLHHLLENILLMCDNIQNARVESLAKSMNTVTDNIQTGLTSLEKDMLALAAELARPRDGSERPNLAIDSAAGSIEQPVSIHVAEVAMLTGNLHQLQRQVSKVHFALAEAEEPKQKKSSSLPPAQPRAAFSFKSRQFHKAVVSSLVLVLLAWFFIQIQWPMGLTLAMVFATITIVLGAMVPLVMIGRQLLWSLVIGAAVAAPLYLWIMPGINQYQQLIPWIGIALLPLLYLMASANPLISIRYLFSAIIVLALLSLDELHQSYSFSTFVNMWFGLLGGFGGGLLAFGLFSSVVPERMFSNQVRSFFASCSEFVSGLKERAKGTSEEMALNSKLRKTWPSIFKQLLMWSAVINYKRMPHNDRYKTQALVEAIGHLALRLPVMERFGQSVAAISDESIRKLFDHFFGDCVESFKMIEDSFTAMKPIPELPDTRGIVREIKSHSDDIWQSVSGGEVSHISVLYFMSATAHMDFLVEAIQECRDKVNALDWETWNRNYL